MIGLYIISKALTLTEKPFYKPHPTVRQSDRLVSFFILPHLNQYFLIQLYFYRLKVLGYKMKE